MRFAVLSDIHSNYAALRAVIADAESRQPDYWLFLGDYVTDCPYPHRTVEFLRDFSQTHPCLMIRGNREDYMINQRKAPQAWEYGSKCGALRYCYEDLTGGDLDWLASQPFTLRPELPGCRLGEYGCRLMLCGHSHIPFIFKREGRMLVNPGALGMPVNEQTKAQYAFLTYNGEWNPEIISVDYDIERTAEEFSSSGLLEKSAVWGRGLLGTIRTGINYTVLAVRLVEKYSQETGLPVTDESLWERAAKELQIP